MGLRYARCGYVDEGPDVAMTIKFVSLSSAGQLFLLMHRKSLSLLISSTKAGKGMSELIIKTSRLTIICYIA